VISSLFLSPFLNLRGRRNREARQLLKEFKWLDIVVTLA
jgi:hypothetical protein